MNTPRLFVITCLLALLPAGALAAAPAHRWSQNYGGTSDQYGQAVAIDAVGNVVVVGTFWGTIDLGGGTLTSVGLTDIFLAKFDATGAHQWSRHFGDANLQQGVAVAVDASGNVVITGQTRGTVNFGGSDLTSAGSSDIFVAKFDATGAHQWSRIFGDTSSDNGTGVAIDDSGNVILSGRFIGTVNFGGADLTSAGGYDAFVASFDPAGTHRWSARFGDFDFQSALSVATGPAAHVLIGGELAGSADFGGSNLVSAGGSDAFVAVFDSLGVHEWSARYGDASDQSCLSVAADASGNAWATGVFAGNIDFGGGPLTSAGDTDVFVARFGALGAHQSSARFGDAGAQTGDAIATDGAGNAFLTGEFSGTIDIGGGPLVSAGGSDIFIVAFDAAGAHRWSQRFGDSGNDGGYGVAATAAGDFAVAGFLRGTVNFGGSDLTSAGGADAFVASFSAIPSGVGAPVDTGSLSVSAYPNPFNPRTTVSFAIPSAGPVTLAIYDARGVHVATLVDREEKPAGVHAVAWNGTDDAGRSVGSGVYFARVSHSSGTRSYKMVLLK